MGCEDGGGENTHTAQTALVFLAPLAVSQHYCSSQDTTILSLSLSSSGLCFVFRAQTFLDSVGTMLSPCALREQ